MSETRELQEMLLSFRVSELQMLLGFAGRNKSGRKSELQARASELLTVRSHPIHQKIRELFKTIQTAAAVQQGANGEQQTATAQATIMPQTRSTASVHPYQVDSRGMLTRQSANMYGTSQSIGQNYNYPPQYPAAPRQQPTVLSTNFPIHPDVKFKRLPFYDIMSDLIKPSTLVPQTNQRMQEQAFYFHLTPQQATDIACSRDIRPGVKNDYIKQVQLRFCLLETTCEQEDCFPPQVIVKVNNKLCPLPNPIPTNKPGVEPKRPPRPVNITQLVKLSPTVANQVTVSWAVEYGRGYAMTVTLVHKLTSSDLLQRLHKKGAKHADHTRALIKEKLNDDDCEIATTSLRVSLMCPLGKMRMTTPCRPATCGHLQCFDASLFLQMNERKPTWNCPVCDKPAIYDNLVIDGYFQEVLSSMQLPTSCNEVQLHKDGSWSVQTNEKKVAKIEKAAPTTISIDDSIQIIDDNVEFVSAVTTSVSTTDSSTKAPGEPVRKRDVVDLTLSDSDDDQPLAKRCPPPKPDSTNKTESSNITSTTPATQRTTTTPGPASVSSSGYPVSPAVINLDSPSPPRSPQVTTQPPSCMLAQSQQDSDAQAQPTPMPYIDIGNEASANLNFMQGY
ncbi:E3 SUMO-protein ligase PIAS2 isoform X2 [Anthonomus grandis grandis]|uniref:E3 SUMO-protein ligase PIAS2 isoform X2 n=1 Tax=Anthonomus grandis grandis TaxID=2921223 RepID=UPI0021656C15|nr:E3 SUMO-protein ligase PIAS2 isoform X2 [Anthonomus grandis grandis]